MLQHLQSDSITILTLLGPGAAGADLIGSASCQDPNHLTTVRLQTCVFMFYVSIIVIIINMCVICHFKFLCDMLHSQDISNGARGHAVAQDFLIDSRTCWYFK